MSEYTADELAEDSDDEKCLEKAEKMTERKASRQKVGKQAEGGQPTTALQKAR